MDYPRELLKAIDSMEIRESYAKIELLDWSEESLYEIQGLVTGGSVQLDGNSSVRRTCNLTLLLNTEKLDFSLEDYVAINRKFRLLIGYKNNLSEYQQYGDILWFKIGLFVFNGVSFSHSLSSCQVSISAKDKMCLLNGDIAGQVPDSVIFHELEYDEVDDKGNISTHYEQVLISNIIKELVNHYGEEKLSKIFINNIPDKARQLMQWSGSKPVYLEKNNKGNYTGNYSYKIEAFTSYEMVSIGQTIGYMLTDFTYPGELISSAGETITSILDKIKNLLGNFEYFYDIDGNFIFQEIRNYVNNSYIPLKQLENNIYYADFDIDEIAYSFKNSNIITSFSNSPSWGSIKNDFVVWGTRKMPSGADVQIRYHLAIDNKPLKTQDNSSEEWRERLYQYGLIAKASARDSGYYWKELAAEWRRLYDPDNKDWKTGWNPLVDSDPESLQYWIDFLEPDSEIGKYSVSNIGRRNITVVDKDCVSVISNDVPDVIFCTSDQYEELLKEGYTPAQVGDDFLKAITISANGKSCYDVIRELLYKNLTLNESITINCLPVYYLEPNTKIEVEDTLSNIYGQYMIKSISLPLTYNGTMSIQATRVTPRI